MSGRPINLGPILTAFQGELASSRALVAEVKALEVVGRKGKKKVGLQSSYVRRVNELAFMGVVSAWEEFIERVFVRYLAGGKSPTSFAPKPKVGVATKPSHAYRIISGNSDYDPEIHFLKFSDAAWVVDQAKFYFDNNGDPFNCLSGPSALLKDAGYIRNRVAHDSTKAKSQFREAALRFVAPTTGKLKKGFAVGDLLRETATRCFSAPIVAKRVTVFEAYLDFYDALAKKIVR